MVLIFAIVYLYRTSSALLEKRNDQFISVLREVGVLLETVSNSNSRSEILMNNVEKVLDRVERKLNEGG